MEFQSIVFLGASDNFFEISQILDDINAVRAQYELIAILDDDPAHHGKRLKGIPVIGGLDKVGDYPGAKFVFGIGSYKTREIREAIFFRLNVPEERFISLVHPTAVVYPTASIGVGCIVYPHSVIDMGAVLESFSIITFQAVIGPRVRVGRSSMVTTRVVVLSDAEIGRSVFIGAGSIVGKGIRIGNGAVVAMGSVVFKDVQPGCVVQGNPSRVLGRTEDVSRLIGANL